MFPSRSARYACETTADCDDDRICADGFCIKAPDAGPVVDAPVVDGPSGQGAPDVDPLAMQCAAAGYNYVSGPNGYYQRITNRASWTDAQAACKAHVAGATHLIVLSTPAEATYMATQVGWVGLSDRTTEGQFVTVTSEVSDQRPWGNDQPSSDGDCVRMENDGLIYDGDCGTDRAFVCECDGRASTP